MYLVCAKFDPSLLTNGAALKSLFLSDKAVVITKEWEACTEESTTEQWYWPEESTTEQWYWPEESATEQWYCIEIILIQEHKWQGKYWILFYSYPKNFIFCVRFQCARVFRRKYNACWVNGATSSPFISRLLTPWQVIRNNVKNLYNTPSF